MQILLEKIENGDFIHPKVIGEFIKYNLLEKEKETIVDFAYKCRNLMAGDEFAISHWYDKTFNEVDITTSVSNVSELVCTQCGGKKDIKFSAMKNFQAYCEDCRDE